MHQAGVDPADSNRGFLTVLYQYVEQDDTTAIEAPKETFFTRAKDSDQWFAKSKAVKLLPLVYPDLMSPLEDFCSLWYKEFAVYNTACILDGQVYGLGVADELRKTFAELLREKNVLCIEDTNTILRDIIDGSDAPFVYEKIGVRYDHFLLDEFQDTSGVQWTNFSPLIGNSDAHGGENLIVGDVKQSIYRWRGSDWKLLDQKVPEEFPTHVEQVLDTNYRSLPSVVNFNNEFFTYAAEVLDEMSGHGANGPLERIYSDVCQKVAKNGGPEGSVSLTFCDKAEELSEVLSAVRTAQENGAEFSDIAVLVRSNAKGSDVASYLISNGVPVITDDSLKVKSSITVRRLVALMSFVDNPENTVSGFLAESFDVSMPESCNSLVDMAEALIRGLKKRGEEGFCEGEALYVQSFMDCLQDYVASNGNSLRGFLKFWESEDPSISSPSSGNSVRVMTIHKSKGLDFPYVIVPFVENITLFKPDNRWCTPDLEGTDLEGVADGVYDVTLSGSTEATLFAGHYRNERFLQQVDNMNTLYVALTRAACGMHIIAKMPSSKVLTAVSDNLPVQFSDFSQMLYSFAACRSLDVEGDGGRLFFGFGQLTDFTALHKDEQTCEMTFPVGAGNIYPSIALNPQSCDKSEDVRERGRMKFSADALDFFSEDGNAGIAASNRIKGVVLHDILSKVISPDDVSSAVSEALHSGMMTSEEALQASELLEKRVREAAYRGWFPEDRESVMTETSIIDVDGQVYRPDRVVRCDGKIIIVDYKFGEPHPGYESQLRKYSDVWERMGYNDVSAYLWYVHTGEIVAVH
jgi:ATP-dependent exoDNAse (exonuclease V) beta subunit